MERIKEIFKLIEFNNTRIGFYKRFDNGDPTSQMFQLKDSKEEAERIYSTLSEEMQREVHSKFEYIKTTYTRAWSR